MSHLNGLMATTTGGEPAAGSGSHTQQLPDRPPERRHVDALLDSSEEGFWKDLEPQQHHCSSGWEDAVHGWATDAPLSCILLSHKRHGKLKHKENDNPTLCDDPSLAGADGLSSTAERRFDSRSGTSTSFKKPTSLSEQMGSWSNTAVAALQSDASEWAVLSGMQETTSRLCLEEDKMLRETPLQLHRLPSKCSVSENRPAKSQKHSHRSCNTVVPIKNFTFLPPINPSHLNSRFGVQLRSGKKASEGEAQDENGLVFDESEARGTRVQPAANTDFHTYSASLTSKLQTWSVSVSVPKRCQVPLSSKFDAVHRTRYSPALQPTTAVGAQACTQPSFLFS